MLLKEFKQDELNVKIYENRKAMGEAVGKKVISTIKELLSEKDEINIIFGAAPSQSELLETILASPDIDWGRVNAFQQDEYIGLDRSASQLFSNFLDRHVYSKVKFKNIYYMRGDGDISKELERYKDLIENKGIDIALTGIGENGHIAFNEPEYADFNDPEIIKVVELDDVCRMQQVNDGCFEKMDDVPKEALTITIPALMKSKYLFSTVPAAQKRKAVKETILGEISESCPASIIRTKENAEMYLDKDSGADFI